MKILHTTTPFFDLTVSAVLATAIHTAVLGIGVGFFLERDPAPIVQNQEQLEYVSMLPVKEKIREPVKKREIVKKEKVNKNPVSRTVREKPQSTEKRVQSRKAVTRRPKNPIEREMTRQPIREKVAVVKHEEPLKPEEKPRIDNHDEEYTGITYARNPKPQIKKGWKAYYPPEAKRKWLEGRVELLITVSAKGRVIHTEVTVSSGHTILDTSMMKQIRSIRFEPALSRAGVPVEWSGTWGWNFNVEDAR